MKVVAYVHPSRVAISPTGVGKHIIHMVTRLARTPGVELSLLAAKDDFDRYSQGAFPLAGIPSRCYPGSRAVMERLWVLLGRPHVDRWSGVCDWIYCPAEAVVPSKRDRVATTIHATYMFEEGLRRSIPRRTEAWLRLMFTRIVRSADLIVTVSEFMRGRLAALFNADSRKIVVVGNGVEAEYFAPSAAALPPMLERFESFALVVGGLNHIKGGDRVLRVARELQQQNRRIGVVVVGQSEPEFIAEAQALPNVLLLPYQPSPVVAALMRRAAALLVLSRYESFGIPAVEAMAAGAPVVSADAGALAEVLAGAGRLVDGDSPGEIAETVRSLADSGALRHAYAERGAIRARDFTWDRCAERLAGALRSRG